MEAEVKSLAEEAEDTPASLYDITEDKSGGEAAGGGEKKKAVQHREPLRGAG